MNTEIMNWQQFKQTLLLHPRLPLQFEYAPGKKVAPSYHITEIKQATVTSVDCGGKMNSWTEVIVQLWEPATGKHLRPMLAEKALSIIQQVEKALPLNPFATVKIEFGNSQFDTRQMYPGELIAAGGELVVHLTPDFTQCKAINRGESCGTEVKETACCTPGSGCC